MGSRSESESVVIPVVVSDRQLALSLAVAHHSLANIVDKAVPARPETITGTADKFLGWLNGTGPRPVPHLPMERK